MEEFELEPGEQVIKRVRKHVFIIVIELIGYAFFAWLPSLIPAFLSAGATASPALTTLALNFSLENPWVRLTLGLWWLFVWIAAFSAFTRYILTQWIITTTRIVDIHQFGFFNRQVSSFLLNRVQDVTTDVDGFFSTILGFGTLNVETAGRDEKFNMTNIAHPADLRDLIMREVAALHADGAPISTGV